MDALSSVASVASVRVCRFGAVRGLGFVILIVDTGIASEKEWGINLSKEIKSESGVNEAGTSWYSDSGEDLGENGYMCRWIVMGGRTGHGSSDHHSYFSGHLGVTLGN